MYFLYSSFSKLGFLLIQTNTAFDIGFQVVTAGVFQCRSFLGFLHCMVKAFSDVFEQCTVSIFTGTESGLAYN